MNNDELLKKLGKHIARLREDAGLTQTELAARCDMERQNMNRIENGRTNPTISTLSLIARELGVPLRRLLEFDL